ncbi:peptide chain release factor N(5)-glutamine methyltransferase [Paenibacillus thermoaerophilus]|uniref:Release factor glutamine methyltransferase n=1 Tax=Paenibacillus thermoaerophilus TaxID=1215385 RepID=A0ABW2V7D3_9BACL|nr:peptide chain release factor N(5)-glutamine methyltransferase [Paenibacillus thermoaerophilus]TMV12466.1 peptide chain release factor N(5)-glutamine methyltransferase [Paenibacillus thermoaerophilus]
MTSGGDSSGTIRSCWRQATDRLKARVDDEREAAFTAELLLRASLGWDRSALFLRWDEPMPEEARSLFSARLERRLAGEPVQYILGEQEFYGRAFAVTPAVLIPRPETELLVERILSEAQRLWPVGGEGSGTNAPLSAADIGTGSGAIAVTLAAERPDWRVTAVDLSADALAVARLNAERMGVAGRIEWLRGDLLGPLEQAGRVPDVLVSNPPYIESAVVDTLAEEVRAYEPRLALDGGADGLDCYRRMAESMSRWPRTPTLVGFEVGAGQARAVAELLERAGAWRRIEIVADYAGIGRHVVAVRR